MVVFLPMALQADCRDLAALAINQVTAWAPTHELLQVLADIFREAIVAIGCVLAMDGRVVAAAGLALHLV
jgi:hypothetical protein